MSVFSFFTGGDNSIPTPPASEIVRQGFLEKRGQWNTAFKKRYFVLTRESLLISNDSSQTLSKAVPIHANVTIMPVPLQTYNAKFCFEVRTPGRVYTLKAGDSPTLESWVTDLRAVVDNDRSHCMHCGQGVHRCPTCTNNFCVSCMEHQSADATKRACSSCFVNRQNARITYHANLLARLAASNDAADAAALAAATKDSSSDGHSPKSPAAAGFSSGVTEGTLIPTGSSVPQATYPGRSALRTPAEDGLGGLHSTPPTHRPPGRKASQPSIFFGTPTRGSANIMDAPLEGTPGAGGGLLQPENGGGLLVAEPPPHTMLTTAGGSTNYSDAQSLFEIFKLKPASSPVSSPATSARSSVAPLPAGVAKYDQANARPRASTDLTALGDAGMISLPGTAPAASAINQAAGTAPGNAPRPRTNSMRRPSGVQSVGTPVGGAGSLLDGPFPESMPVLGTPLGADGALAVPRSATPQRSSTPMFGSINLKELQAQGINPFLQLPTDAPHATTATATTSRPVSSATMGATTFARRQEESVFLALECTRLVLPKTNKPLLYAVLAGRAGGGCAHCLHAGGGSSGLLTSGFGTAGIPEMTDADDHPMGGWEMGSSEISRTELAPRGTSVYFAHLLEVPITAAAAAQTLGGGGKAPRPVSTLNVGTLNVGTPSSAPNAFLSGRVDNAGGAVGDSYRAPSASVSAGVPVDSSAQDQHLTFTLFLGEQDDYGTPDFKLAVGQVCCVISSFVAAVADNSAAAEPTPEGFNRKRGRTLDRTVDQRLVPVPGAQISGPLVRSDGSLVGSIRITAMPVIIGTVDCGTLVHNRRHFGFLLDALGTPRGVPRSIGTANELGEDKEISMPVLDFAFPALNQRLTCTEELAETPFVFAVPTALLLLFAEGTMSQALTAMDNYMSARRANRIPGTSISPQLVEAATAVSLCLDHMDAIEQCMAICATKQYEGSTFKRSALKADKAVQFLATNLHIQSTSIRINAEDAAPANPVGAVLHDAVVVGPEGELLAVFDCITVGAFAAHAYGFAEQGLTQMICPDGHPVPPREDAAGSRHAAANPTPANYTAAAAAQSSGKGDKDKGEHHDATTNLKQQLRRELVFAQAVTAAVTAFTLRIDRCVNHAVPREGERLLAQLAELGFLISIESLLSTLGSELGMLGDFAVAVTDLDCVSFRLTQLPPGPNGELGVVKDSIKIYPNDIPRTTGIFGAPPVTIVIALDVQCATVQLPPEVQKGALVPVQAVIFTQGINANQTVANAVGAVQDYLSITRSTSIQEDVNRASFQRLKAYYAKFRLYVQRVTQCEWSSFSGLNAKVEEFGTLCHQSGGKNISLLVAAEDTARLLGAARVTCCKSAKDRTGMAVTLEQARLVAHYHATHDSALRMANIMRSRGVRRDNCLKNIGKRIYAFNPMVRWFLPMEHQPPAGSSKQWTEETED